MAVPARKPAANQAKPAKPVERNTIQFDSTQLGHFLDGRDKDNPAGGSSKRVHVRWPYRVATVHATFTHPGGTDSRVVVACRNLSAGGMAILHRTFLHKGTKCTLSLPTTSGSMTDVSGVVVRCTHLQGTIHEMGIQFATHICARDFVKMDPFADGFSFEKVKPDELKGTLLYVDDSALDRSLIQHFLRETQIRLLLAEDRAVAMEKVREGVDLILCDFYLGAGSGAELVAALRADDIATPVIMVTADTSDATREKIMECEASAFIGKPLSPGTLFRAIAEFVVVGNSSNMFVSSLPPEHPNRGLLPTFVKQVRDYAAALEKAVAQNSSAICKTLCLQISGAAPVMGFDRLAAVAQEVERAMTAAKSMKEASVVLNRLIESCRQVSDRG